LFDWIFTCGCAALRAESLWLSDGYDLFKAAMPLRRSLEEFQTGDGKPEAFRTEGGKAASLSDTLLA